nr:hypothetical protein CFP56_28353 [Quercus suber]
MVSTASFEPVAARLGCSCFCCSSVIATIVDIITPINEIWISTPWNDDQVNARVQGSIRNLEDNSLPP